MNPDFYPYHPLKLRLWLLAGLVVSLSLAIWALVGFVDSRLPRDILRAGLSLGLAAAMAVSVFRLRPRPGWGVQITQLSVLISKPRGGLIEVPWTAVKEVRRFGEQRDTLGLWLEQDQRVLVPAHLFAKRAHFEALAAAVDERMPPARKGDASVN